MSFSGSSQGQFNYHDRIPHGWDFQYAQISQDQFNYQARIPQPYLPPIPSPFGAPVQRRLPNAYCEICQVWFPDKDTSWDRHNNGRKHQTKLRWKASKGQESSQIPNSQMNSVVQPKTVLESEKSKCHVENVSEATISKHKNFQQKDTGVSSKIPAEGPEGKPKDNSSGKGCGFKREIGVDTVGKYMKMNNGIKRPMESLKPDVSALSNSAELLVQKPALTPLPGPASPVLTSTCLSLLKLQSQHVSASQTQVSEGKEHRGIQNPTADFVVSTMTEDMSSDSAALARAASLKGHMASQVHVPTIPSPSVAPFRHPQPRPYCEICDIELSSEKCLITHNKGRKHRSKLRQKASNGQESSQIPNSKMNSVVQPKTVLESKKSKCPLENVSSQATVSKHKNSQQKDIGVSSKVPAEGSEGKPKDNTSGKVCGFKRGIGEGTVGKYMKMNNGMKRPMESNSAKLLVQKPALTTPLPGLASPKPDGSAPSNSAESVVQRPALTPPPGPALPIMTPTCVGGSSLKLQFQHVSASGTQVSEDKEHYEIQNPTAEKIDQPQSTSEESHDQAASDVSTLTEDMSFDSATLAVAASPKGPMASQVTVCLKCGDEGFSDTFVFCNKCEVYALHRYCLDGPVNFYDDVTWFCEDCETHEVGESCNYQGTLLSSRTSDSANSAEDASGGKSELTNYIERIKDNNKQQQNIAAKTKALLSDCHSLSNHAQSQSISNCEEENKFKEDCQSAPNVEANSSEGSVIIHDARPIVDPIWRGSWCFSKQSSCTVTGLLAHLSTLACPEVLEETRLFPEVLSANLLQRSALWPKAFVKSGPNDESIALYFFPESERVERAYNNLVDDMISHDLAIRVVVKNAELLVFPSTVLPVQHKKFQAKYYLWGVFRAKQPV